MGRKLRHVLIFLLIILKEPNMPEADCSASCVKHAYYPSFKNCDCPNLGLTNIPQNLPSSTYKRGRDSDSGSNSNPTLHNTKDGQLDQTGQGQSQTITESDTSTTAVVVTSGLDHEYEDIDQHNQRRQGRSRAITESNRKTPSVITRRVKTPAKDPTTEIASGRYQTGLGVKTPPKDPNTTYTNMTSCSGHGQTGLAQAQANTESLGHVRSPSNTTRPAVMQAHNCDCCAVVDL
ncbi:hypothetical protein Bbelb_395750 [Branchiostoma belcheri]|nr:hypothetical protein Bbelb_395750 [Branchiostoma belcheri]